MDPVERMLIERACERLVVTNSHYLDLGDPARAAELFAEDAVWEMPGVLRFEGRAALAEGFGGRLAAAGRTTRHVCTNIAIDVQSPDEATGVCYLVNFRHDPASGDDEDLPPSDVPKYIGEYHDRYVRTPDGWRIAYRRADLAFSRRDASAG